MFPNSLRSLVLSRLVTREVSRIYHTLFASLAAKGKFGKVSKSLKII